MVPTDDAGRPRSSHKPTLTRSYARKAYRMARDFERDSILPDGTTHQGRTPAHWRRVALLIAKRTGRALGLGTATRMANRL